MQSRAVLSNAQHPEYGVVTIPYPIPAEQYDEIIEMLGALEIGDPLKRDCHVDNISEDWPVLKRLENAAVNVDELDYLAKRLDSFSVGEDDQFQGMAAKLGITDMTDLINFTFCCQQATVIADFSDLDKVGHDHAMNLNGGAMAMDAYKNLDGRKAALKLIKQEAGTITPYGVVYDNGMKLEQLYTGQNFPAYFYDDFTLALEIRPRNAPEEEPGAFLFLPMTQLQIDRAMQRSGIDSCENMCMRFVESRLPDEVDIVLDMEHESLSALNQMAIAIADLAPADKEKLGAVVSVAAPEDAFHVMQLTKNLDFFDFIPAAKTAEDYGRYMIQKSEHFEYDENLADYYDYEKYGRARMAQESGWFVDRGYISYHGTLSMEELMMENPAEQVQADFQMGGLE